MTTGTAFITAAASSVQIQELSRTGKAKTSGVMIIPTRSIAASCQPIPGRLLAIVIERWQRVIERMPTCGSRLVHPFTGSCHDGSANLLVSGLA